MIRSLLLITTELFSNPKLNQISFPRAGHAQTVSPKAFNY